MRTTTWLQIKGAFDEFHGSFVLVPVFRLVDRVRRVGTKVGGGSVSSCSQKEIKVIRRVENCRIGSVVVSLRVIKLLNWLYSFGSNLCVKYVVKSLTKLCCQCEAMGSGRFQASGLWHRVFGASNMRGIVVPSSSCFFWTDQPRKITALSSSETSETRVWPNVCESVLESDFQRPESVLLRAVSTARQFVPFWNQMWCCRLLSENIGCFWWRVFEDFTDVVVIAIKIVWWGLFSACPLSCTVTQTRRNVPEDQNPQQHLWENPKSLARWTMNRVSVCAVQLWNSLNIWEQP